jgi:hypothetical protein
MDIVIFFVVLVLIVLFAAIYLRRWRAYPMGFKDRR